MSSLLEDHLISVSLKKRDIMNGRACWEFLSCSKVLCPAHSKRESDCWLIPRTQCSNYIGEDFFEKLSSCLICPYFKAKGENSSRDHYHFLVDQVQRYNFKALEQIYQKEESFIEILNRIPDGLFTTDAEWRITYFNPAAEKITGFSAYDAVGMYCKDVFKNSICETDCALKRAVAEKSDIHNREYEITNIDGKQIPIICSTSAFRDSLGNITGGIEIFKDITLLKRLQEEITTRERKYRRIFEGSREMIYTTNEPGKILAVNQAGVEMLGYKSKDDLLGIDNAEWLYFKPSDRDRFIKRINHEGFVKDYEVAFKKCDGSPIHVLISSRRYENLETGDIEYEGIIKDITRRKRAEDVLKQRNLELSILNNIALTLNLTRDLNHILTKTLEHVLKVLGLKRGAIFLINREEKTASLQVRQGLPVQDPENADTIIFKDTLLMKHIIKEKALLTPEPAFPCFQARYKTKKGRPSRWLSCFLITFKGRAVGFFGLHIPSSRNVSAHEVHLLGSLGNYLGGAIENTQLTDTIRLHQQELRRLTEKLFQSQEEERRRIARELHDEAGQALTAIKLGLDRLEENVTSETEHLKEDINEIRKMITRTASEMRRLSYRLHPTLLSDLGLEPALELYFKEVKSRSDLDIEFHMVGFDKRLDADMETVLYRFSQEALTNTLKHANARHFRLSIIKSYPNIIFLAEDDGIGFDSRIVGTNQRSLGLLGMRERASMLGGTFQLRTKPSEGTRIRIETPLSEAHDYGKTHKNSAR
ncbi:MAG: PAS domain S-box protein [Desulfobacteraceae bacterium]|nr:MAG: PAS domain S-box protein [Desulfobacteraceae bacterium]